MPISRWMGPRAVTGCIDSELAEELTITGTATLSNADGILTEGPLTLEQADLTLTGNIDGDVGDDAIRAGRSDEDITIQNSKVTIAGTNAEGNFFNYGIRCGKLTVANSTLDVKVCGSAIVAADEMEGFRRRHRHHGGNGCIGGTGLLCPRTGTPDHVSRP